MLNLRGAIQLAELEVFGIEEWIRELENLGQDVPKITKRSIKSGCGSI